MLHHSNMVILTKRKKIWLFIIFLYKIIFQRKPSMLHIIGVFLAGDR